MLSTSTSEDDREDDAEGIFWALLSLSGDAGRVSGRAGRSIVLPTSIGDVGRVDGSGGRPGTSSALTGSTNLEGV